MGWVVVKPLPFLTSPPSSSLSLSPPLLPSPLPPLEDDPAEGAVVIVTPFLVIAAADDDDDDGMGMGVGATTRHREKDHECKG